MSGLSRLQAGSRFDRGVTAPVHGHRRRASAQDDYCRVMVRIGGEAAVGAGKYRLALAAGCIDDSTLGTRLAGVGGIDFDERPAALRQLVIELGGERAPALRQDAAVQPALALTRRAHTRNLQILDHYETEAVGNGPAHLVLPVTADAGDASGQPSHAAELLAPPSGSAIAATEYLLSTAALPVEPGQVRKVERLAVGERETDGDSTINADRRIIVCRRAMLNFTDESDMPAQSISADCDVQHATNDRARPPELDPSKARQANGGPSAIDHANGHLLGLEPETVMVAAPPICRKPGTASEKPSESFIQITQGLVQAAGWNRPDPIDIAPERGHFPALAGKVQSAACRGSILPPEVSALLKCEIVNEPHHASPLPERSFLLKSRCQPIAKSAVDHLHFLSSSWVSDND